MGSWRYCLPGTMYAMTRRNGTLNGVKVLQIARKQLVVFWLLQFGPEVPLDGEWSAA
jgi:hypothetical protein